ncbi:MAG: tyrosine-type recombinase/integrase [bacterium]|nr:tyrosine-type recombinase/integrase [bacterium]
MNSLRDALAEYLTFRRKFGTHLYEPGIALGHFVEFLEAEGLEWITTECAVRWATLPAGVQPATWARRLGHVRGFARWLKATDPRNEIPDRRLVNARHRRKSPYIFTDLEITQLMAEAARLSSPAGLRSLTYVTLIGLLASTGLRPGEALALNMPDVDLGEGILAIRETKFGKSRVVPVTNSTRAALAHYAQRRRQLSRPGWSDAFLVSEDGTRIVSCTARKTFARLSCATGIRAPKTNGGLGRGPRQQDLRHTFATRKLIAWYRVGINVTQKMPILSTYLGHASVHETYWYIQAVPELLQLATKYSAACARDGAR